LQGSHDRAELIDGYRNDLERMCHNGAAYFKMLM
jgi:hypothetical protein